MFDISPNFYGSSSHGIKRPIKPIDPVVNIMIRAFSFRLAVSQVRPALSEVQSKLKITVVYFTACRV